MKKLALFLFIAVSLNHYGQEVKFGKVSKEELTEKFNPQDSSGSATYLYKYRKTFFQYNQQRGFKLVTEIHDRIKIYTKDGFDYATKKIHLYKQGSDKEEISSLKAVTYNLVDNNVEEMKLKKDGEFEVELSKYYDEKSFTMPNIKEGSVIEYKYRIESPFLAKVDEFVFQHDIQVKRIVASMEYPEYFNFRMNAKGFLPINPKIEESNGKINFQSKHRSNTSLREGYASRTQYKSSIIDFIKTEHSYDLTNIPALKDEPFVNNIDNYKSAVKYELSFVKFPDNPIDYYATTWEDVVKNIYKSSSFGSELDKKGYYEDDLESLVAGVNDPVKRASLIFNFVKSKVKWNGMYSKYVDEGVRKAYKEGVGNVAEINLMLTSMLRHANLKANPILVSTRHNGIPLFPTRDGYNYVISGVELNGRTMLLDATSTFSDVNILPLRTLNWQGRLIMENGNSTTIELIPSEKARDMVMMNVTLSEDGSIEGILREQYMKHKALLFRKKYHKAEEDAFLEEEEIENGDIEISNYEVKNVSDLSKPIVQSYEFIKEDAIDRVAGKLYFTPFFQFAINENPFKLEKREFPVDFGYPAIDKYIINIKIPEGYDIEYLPKPQVITLPNNLGTFKYNIDSNSNTSTINLKAELVFNSAIIGPQYYDVLKEFYKQLVLKETEKVVLSKTSQNEYPNSPAEGR